MEKWMALKRKTPLRCRLFERVLIIEIGIDTLKNAAEHHNDFWQPHTDKFALVVNNPDRFARDVIAGLQDEGEDGSTPISRTLDVAILHAVEQGSEGIDLEAMDKIEAAERLQASGSGGT
jgi:hypothetical protein